MGHKNSVPPSHDSRRDAPAASKRGTSWRSHKRSADKSWSNAGSSSGHASSGVKRKARACLNPDCGELHLVKDCTNTPEPLRQKLLSEFYEQRKNEKRQKKGPDGGIRALTADDSNNTSLFNVHFADRVKTVALADQGSDVSIVPPDILELLAGKINGLEVTTLGTTHFYATADKNSPPLPCKKQIVADIHISVRHAKQLTIRRVTWLVSDRPVPFVIIGRDVLSLLGLDNRTSLSAAYDRFNGEFDAADQGVYEHEEGSIASLVGSSFYSDAQVGEQDEPEQLYVEIGEDNECEVAQALEKLVEKAEANGLSKRGAKRLRKMIDRYKKIFRLKLGRAPPARVTPMRIRLKPNAKPVKMKARGYSPQQREFINNYIQKLLDMDMVELRPTAEWQCAPLAVLKPGSRNRYRLANDLRPVNDATVKEAWPMPNIESEITDFAGAIFFASLDFIASFWQLPLHPDCYEICGIIAPLCVVASKRVLQGLGNSTAHFQSSVEPLFQELRANMKAFLDDFSLHARTEDQILDLLERFFAICAEYGLFLSARKCEFFKTSLEWCGRIIDKDGYRLAPHRLEALQNMDEPQTGAELAEFLYCCRWMALGIPDFARLSKPLAEILERAFAKSGKRTKRSIKSIQLRNLSWGTEHRQAHEKLQESLRNSVRLSFLRKSWTVCVHTDASEDYWSGIVSQTPPGELAKLRAEQKHEPLAFVVAAFDKTQQGWTTFEKEAFAIYKTFEKLDYIFFAANESRVFTDHRNLLFVYAPQAIDPQIGRHVVNKVQRWALFLSLFAYGIEHIDGSANVFADILTRWAHGYRKKLNYAVCSLTFIGQQQLLPGAADIVWPSLDEIKEAQTAHPSRSTRTVMGHDGVRRLDDKIWIPHQAVDLKLKLLVVAHAGSRGHRATDGTASILAEMFKWTGMRRDAEEFCHKCLHCIISRTGQAVPSPLAHALHGSEPNEVIHADFLYMGPGTGGEKYCLIIKDDFSSYVRLFACKDATSDSAAEDFLSWITANGTVEWVCTDQRSHFKNELVSAIMSETRMQHHFVTAYSPWANGTVERVCREVLRTCTALGSEWKLGAQDWPSMLDCIQSVLNHAPLKRLGPRNASEANVFRTPMDVFFGRRPRRPLLRAVPPSLHRTAMSEDELKLARKVQIDKLQDAIEEMHREVDEMITTERERQVAAHNAKTGIQPVSFEQGDFLLLRRAKSGGHKLAFNWIGPKRVKEAKSPLVYVVEDLSSGRIEEAHARRLVLYRADMDGQDVDEALVLAAEHNKSSFQIVKCLRDIRQTKQQMEVLVEWSGLPDSVDFTWEPARQIAEDIPTVMEEFLQAPGKPTVKAKARKMFSSLLHSSSG